MQGLDSLLHGEGVVCLEVLLLGCSGNVFVEEVSSDTLRLGTCVWGVWEGRDALMCFLGAVVHTMCECGRNAHGNCGVQKG